MLGGKRWFFMRAITAIGGMGDSRSVADQSVSPVTQLLCAVEPGNQPATEQVLDLVYSELHRLAVQKMAGERPGHTLQPTALVHEAWLRLSSKPDAHFENRAHFFCAAGEAMRRILIDGARRRLTSKRGLGMEPVDVDDVEIASPATDDHVLLDLNDALAKFAALHPQKAELVKLRYFVGMTVDEVAEALGIAVPTAKKWWAYARAWFRIEMG